jgi:hypothetical protein
MGIFGTRMGFFFGTRIERIGHGLNVLDTDFLPAAFWDLAEGIENLK